MHTGQLRLQLAELLQRHRQGITSNGCTAWLALLQQNVPAA